MRSLRFDRSPLNPPALDEALRADLGAAYLGFSLTPAALILHLHADSADAEKHARRIVRDHDADRPSAAQMRQREREQQLAAARAQAGPPLDPADVTEPRLAAVIRRLNWLEAEVLALRGD